MKYIDLTMLLNEKTPVTPCNQKPVFEQSAVLAKDGFNDRTFTINSHLGTHVDFPYHMLENGKSQNDFAIGDFIGTGRLIDARGQKNINASLGGVQPGDIVLILTSHSKKAACADYFDSAPVFTEEFVNELVKKKIKMVGIDSWTPDFSPYALHKILFSHGIPIIENLVNLEPLLNKEFKVFVAPLRLDSSDGAPARVFAEIKE